MNDIQKLEDLVRLFLDGKPLPDVEGIPAVDWLHYLRNDQVPFNTALASGLDLQSNPATVCEAAMTLRGRLLSAS